MSTTQTPTGTPPPSTERAGWWQRQTTTARVLVVAVPLLVVVLLVAVFFPRSPQPAETLPATTGTPERANACLGGSTDLNSAVQYAQANAPLTGAGAAEFLATYVRWSNGSPSPTVAEMEALLPRLVTSEALPGFLPLRGNQPSPRPVASASALGGSYRIDEATPTSATVSLVMSRTATFPGAAPTELTLWGSYTVAAVDGVWRIAGVPVSTDQASITARGQQFQGSC